MPSSTLQYLTFALEIDRDTIVEYPRRYIRHESATWDATVSLECVDPYLVHQFVDVARAAYVSQLVLRNVSTKRNGLLAGGEIS